VLLITVPIYRGIEISTDTTVWLTIVEILIIVALAVTSLLHPGDGHLRLQIFTFTGFESVAPLAEETRDPKRTLPRSILFSIILMGIFFVLCSWAMLIGWGTSHLDSFVHAPENPLLLLARRLWGAAWVLVLVAVVNSILAASIASTNACTRVFYAMGRARSLPASLENVHSRFRTPVNAILLETAITLAIGLGVGLWIGPDQEYYFLGVAMTLGLIFNLRGWQRRGLRLLQARTTRRIQPAVPLHLPAIFVGVFVLGCLQIGGPATRTADSLRAVSSGCLAACRRCSSVDGAARFRHCSGASRHHE